MKFSCYVDIDVQRDRLVELFDNPENLKHWQDGFISFEHLNGHPGHPGSQSKMIYKIGKRGMELIETIKVYNLPEEFTALYEFKEGANTMTVSFEDLGYGKTRYHSEVEYIQMNSFMMKMMSVLMPGMFKKQVKKWMDQFKAFAENGDSIVN